MQVIKKIVHSVVGPFVDSGPFGAGPAFSQRNPRPLSRAIFKLSQDTWTPPSALFNGKLGEIVASIGARYPVLSVGKGSELVHGDRDFCERMVKAAERSGITGDLDEPVYRHFQDGDADLDRLGFLRQLMDSGLADQSCNVTVKLMAANIVGRSDFSQSDISGDHWEVICRDCYVYSLFERDVLDEELARIFDLPAHALGR
jgi:hypothetical protein